MTLSIFHNKNVNVIVHVYIEWKIRGRIVSAFVFVSIAVLIVWRHSNHRSLTFLDICNCIFKDISIVIALDDRSEGRVFLSAPSNKNNVSLGTKVGQTSLQPIIKHWGFTNSGFLSYDTNPLSAQGAPGLRRTTFVEIGVERPWCKREICCLLFHEQQSPCLWPDSLISPATIHENVAS